MLRDSPFIVSLILIIGALIAVGSIWYVSDINEDSTVSTLNETLRATTISQVDLSSRIEPGVVILNQDGEANLDVDNPDFETELLNQIAKSELSNGSIVRIDYATVEVTDEMPATIYAYNLDPETGDVTWTPSIEGVTSPIRPLNDREHVEGVRVRVRKAGHSANVDDPEYSDFLSYQSTVEVNRSDKVVSVMEEPADVE